MLVEQDCDRRVDYLLDQLETLDPKGTLTRLQHLRPKRNAITTQSSHQTPFQAWQEEISSN